MKRGKDEEKRMDALFPRLHINDTEKGGPRAPPRNKMAFSEQLIIPSQKFNPGSSSMFSLPANRGSSSSSVPSASFTLSESNKRISLPPSCNSMASHDSAERCYSYSSDGVNLNANLTNLEWLSVKSINNQMVIAKGSLTRTAPLSLFQPHNISNAKKSSVTKFEERNDPGIATISKSVQMSSCVDGQQKMEKERLASSSGKHSVQINCEKQLKQNRAADFDSKRNQRKQTEENTETHSHTERSALFFKNGGNVSLHAFDQAHAFLKPINLKKRSRLLDDLSSLRDPSLKEYKSLEEDEVLKDGVPEEPDKNRRKRSASTLYGLSSSIHPLEDSQRRSKDLQTVPDSHENNVCQSLHEGDADRNTDVSDTSVVDSISGLDVSPDDVIEIMGHKLFWSTRKTIFHQQRVFAMQVFELHRVIKVQRLIARSPELLVEDYFYQRKPSKEASPGKKSLAEDILALPPLAVKQNAGLQKDHRKECSAENAVRKPPLSPANTDSEKGPIAWQSDNKNVFSENRPPLSMISDTKLTPLCFKPPPEHQWLIPVRSPSEGLVYKPYTGPCPPTAGFMAPVYGSCGPMSLISITGDFSNTAFSAPASDTKGIGIGILSSTPAVGQTYFPPYATAVVNPSGSSSTVGQLNNQFARAMPNGREKHSAVQDTNVSIPCQSPCEMPTQMSRAVPSCVRNAQVSNESDLQGNTTSSPSGGRAQADVLPLFPTSPIVQISDQPPQTHRTEQRIKVIKVVPHNPKSASESAARIFQSIQAERKLS